MTPILSINQSPSFYGHSGFHVDQQKVCNVLSKYYINVPYNLAILRRSYYSRGGIRRAVKSLPCSMPSSVSGKTQILLHLLFEGTMRFGELRSAISGITHKVLTDNLRELEAHGIVERVLSIHRYHRKSSTP